MNNQKHAEMEMKMLSNPLIREIKRYLDVNFDCLNALVYKKEKF